MRVHPWLTSVRALCTVRSQDANGNDIKGYFRIDGECKECPDSPELILVGMVLVIIIGCAGGYYLQDKDVNVAFISIGIDYFQVLSVFARIKIHWPDWIKDLIRAMSFFNLNIDLAAPECILPSFDFLYKWWSMMLLPAVVGTVLFLLWLFLILFKVVFKNRRRDLCNHTSKLISISHIAFLPPIPLVD